MMTHAEWQRWRACGRKRRHASLRAANATVLQHWARGEWAWRIPCEHCGGWHITTDESHRREARVR